MGCGGSAAVAGLKVTTSVELESQSWEPGPLKSGPQRHSQQLVCGWSLGTLTCIRAGHGHIGQMRKDTNPTVGWAPIACLSGSVGVDLGSSGGRVLPGQGRVVGLRAESTSGSTGTQHPHTLRPSSPHCLPPSLGLPLPHHTCTCCLMSATHSPQEP